MYVKFCMTFKITFLTKTTSLLIYSLLAKNEDNLLISRRYFAISGTFVPIILCIATVWKINAILPFYAYRSIRFIRYIVIVEGLPGTKAQIRLKYM